MVNYSNIANLADAIFNRIRTDFFRGFEKGWQRTERENDTIFSLILGTGFAEEAKLNVITHTGKFAEALAAIIGALFNMPLHAVASPNNKFPYLNYVKNLKIHNAEFCRLVAVIARYNLEGRFENITSRLSADKSDNYKRFLIEIIQTCI